MEGDQAVISMVECADSLQPFYSISEVPQVSERERSPEKYGLVHETTIIIMWYILFRVCLQGRTY